MSESKATTEALAGLLNELGRIEAIVRADNKTTREWSTAEAKRITDEVNAILDNLNKRLVEMHSDALKHNGPLRLRIAAELLANSDHSLDRQSKALEAGLAALAAEPERFKRYNAANGWGLHEHFMPFVRGYLEACRAHPDAFVAVSR